MRTAFGCLSFGGVLIIGDKTNDGSDNAIRVSRWREIDLETLSRRTLPNEAEPGDGTSDGRENERRDR
jgi:hypothetical protein